MSTDLSAAAGPVPQLSDQELDAAIETQFVTYFPQFRDRPEMKVYEGPDMARWETGVDCAFLNGVARAVLPSEEADARIAEIVGPFRARKISMVWAVSPCVRPLDMAARLESCGLAAEGDLVAMDRDLDELFADDSPTGREAAGLTIREVTTGPMFRDWLRPAVRSAGFSPAAAEMMYRLHATGELGPGAALRHFVGWWERSPVACSTLYLFAGVAGVFNVETDPDARRRGFGTAVTVAALRQARAAGYRHGVLHSSEMGLSVYQKLGFRERFRIGLYALSHE